MSQQPQPTEHERAANAYAAAQPQREAAEAAADTARTNGAQAAGTR